MQIDRERLAQVLDEPSAWTIESILADIEAQGFVIVPREPTEAMVDRFVSRALCVSIHGDGGWSNYAMEQWKTMIEAGK